METYPEVSGTSVKVQLQILRWGSDTHGRQVHGIVLHIFGRDLAYLIAGGALLPHQLANMSPAPDGLVSVRTAGLLDGAAEGVGTRLGGMEAVLADQVHIGLGA